MNFSKALELLKEGKRVARSNWNGKNMFIYLVKGNVLSPDKLMNEALEHVGSSNKQNNVSVNSHIDMKAADGSIVIGWLASQTDLLAEDWEVVNK